VVAAATATTVAVGVVTAIKGAEAVAAAKVIKGTAAVVVAAV
jgi:hypothetical protein